MGDKNTSFGSNGKRQIKGKSFVLNLNSPLVMGILNSTPDSFYDGGRYNREESWLIQAGKMVDEGVDIIDIGGMSTRPGAKPVLETEEIERVLAPLQLIKREFPKVPVSIDTFRSVVADICVSEGADMVNDISGGTFDNDMFSTIARLNVPYILMHIHGTPKTMQQNPIEHHIIEKVKDFFDQRVRLLYDLGVKDIILDPGFGFGKSLDCNYTLLKNMEQTRIKDLPLLAGISRKSMINKVLDIIPEHALNGTTVLNLLALQNGANMLRVHDVKEAKEVIKLYEYYVIDRC